jgi:agmatine deiminase
VGLFNKKETPVIADVANWPGVENAMQQTLSAAHSECVSDCMPAEWFPQYCVEITWPNENTDWKPWLAEATKCYLRLAYEISVTERLLIVCSDPDGLNALLREQLPQRALDNITLVGCRFNDTWIRDYGPITVMENGDYRLLDFRFNGWGGKFEASADNAVNKTVCPQWLTRGEYRDMQSFVLEGGSIESDGQGTLLTTSRCLLNPNRNPSMGKAEIEDFLLRELKSQQMLWLDYGYLEGDDTDSHIDTLARLCPSDTIAYVRCSDTSDSHYEELKQMERQLQSFRTLRGEPFRLVALPMAPVLRDADGMRLPATYANYLVLNRRRILMPTYGDSALDATAAQALETAFPGYSVTGVDCRVLVEQHGSLHCSTMQCY